MSPYPSQTDRESVVATATLLIERDGVDGLSLAAVAAELGIKAPSLYRYIESKNELLHAVIEHTYRDMFAAYDAALAASGDDPAERLHALARAQRRFAYANPNTYMLAYTTANPVLRANPDMLLERAVEIQRIMARISGEPESLTALRGSLALTHGFITLELNGQLRRGGDLAETFDAVVEAYLRGWQEID